ncbi:Holliday junction resolvase RuvX [Sphingobacterium sp. lm-10]|uniref:Holliday junction resolvase RuvX n=1 Tax=Sphingobacterium sp. lm-10 TaxID=2944904 RepID=UPI0020206D92|nr:Holliday junction resolvase RuvX [Sphingobacterium sp. lm-10]MCL7988687.1 Holliday junction resolvase RuvX [Sphingobacterium sp. lm-10]
MRILAFDYGTKRVGIAVTDPLQIIANPLTTLHPEKLWPFLHEYMLSEAVVTFVVGKPRQLDGTDSQSAAHVVGFIRRLQREFPTIPVVEIDERFTSKMASAAISQSGMSRKKRQNKETVDTVSATIILQDYLNSKSIY